jgi:hypothetical protein
MTCGGTGEADELLLCELYVVVRPEEKRAVMLTLDALVGPVYTTIAAVGRGHSGLTYEGKKATSLVKRLWGNIEALTVFLPKAIFYLVIPRASADEVLARGITR